MNIEDLPDYAISIRQPWASAAVCAGSIDFVIPKPPNIYGSVCIHAAAKRQTRKDISDVADEFYGRISPLQMIEISFGPIYGAIIATADYDTDLVHNNISPYLVTRLTNIQTVNSIAVRGSAGFFKWKKRIRNDKS